MSLPRENKLGGQSSHDTALYTGKKTPESAHLTSEARSTTQIVPSIVSPSNEGGQGGARTFVSAGSTVAAGAVELICLASGNVHVPRVWVRRRPDASFLQ